MAECHGAPRGQGVVSGLVCEVPEMMAALRDAWLLSAA